MRRVAFAILLPFVMSQGAFAAPQTSGKAEVLAPGKPAGVKQAQDQDSMVPLAVFGAAAIGIGIALAVSDNGDATTPSTPPVTTTTTTAP
jgi:hypothetical protein